MRKLEHRHLFKPNNSHRKAVNYHNTVGFFACYFYKTKKYINFLNYSLNVENVYSTEVNFYVIIPKLWTFRFNTGSDEILGNMYA